MFFRDGVEGNMELRQRGRKMRNDDQTTENRPEANALKDKTPRRAALFGGTFDPVHLAHLSIARAAVEQAGLDRVIFLPAARNPLKPTGPEATDAQRLEMLRAAAEGLPWAEVSDWELRRAGEMERADAAAGGRPGGERRAVFSWETAERFVKDGPPGARWHWLMGADQWASLDRWRRPDYLASLVTFLVFAREGEQPAERPGVRAVFLKGEFPGSSTEVRRRVAAGEDVSALTGPRVAEIIRRDGLYR